MGGGSGGSADGTDLDISEYTQLEWACFPGVCIHGGMTLPIIRAAGIPDMIRNAGVPLALAKPRPDDHWDPIHRQEMGGPSGWAVSVYSQEGTTKQEFLDSPKDYVTKNDCGPS